MLCINAKIQLFSTRFEHKYATSQFIRIHFVRKPAKGREPLGYWYLSLCRSRTFSLGSVSAAALSGEP